MRLAAFEDGALDVGGEESEARSRMASSSDSRAARFVQ
jgi:hypothetical protein